MWKFGVLVFWCSIVISNALDTVTEKSRESNDIVAKRDLKPDPGLSKAYDPPPEYYRGPGSSYERDRNKDRDVIGLQGPFRGTGAYGHDVKYPPKGGSGYYDGNRRPSQDRISVGHYGGPSSAEGGPHYGQVPYGDPHPVDLTTSYGPTAPGPDKYPPPGHYLPEHPVGFDLYNKGYGDYGHPYPPSGYYPHNKAELAKSFLIPLAGVAILGITAALIANPLLLHLGTVSSGKRRRRDVNGNIKSHQLAYRAHVHN